MRPVHRPLLQNLYSFALLPPYAVAGADLDALLNTTKTPSGPERASMLHGCWQQTHNEPTANPVGLMLRQAYEEAAQGGGAC